MKTKRDRISTSKLILFQIVTVLCVFLFASGVVFAAPSDDFVITVKTDNPGASSNTQFKIPTTNRDGETYNYNVDCNNDGTNEATGVTGDYTCNYTSLGGVGTYTVRIKDNTGTGTGFPRIYFYDYHGNSDSEKLLSVNQWGTGHWTSMAFAFYGCNKLNSATAINSGGGALPDWATDAPDLSNVTSMAFMFYNNWSFNQNISNWNVSNVTDMAGMFNTASSFNQDISGWNVSNVTNMFSMFQSASSFNQNLAGWDVSNVDNMSGMFSYSGMSTDSYDDTLIGWSARNLKNNIQLDSSAHYCRSETQRQNIIDTYHWTINDAGKSCAVVDTDNDGISDADENGVAGGDGNGDGTPDMNQPNVMSLPAGAGGGYVTIEAPSSCAMSDVQTIAEPNNPADPNYDFPYGLVEFRLHCNSANVKIYYHGANSLTDYTYRKYGPTPPNFNDANWYTLPNVTYGTSNIGGNTVAYAEFTLTDGGLGDDTGVDGVIVDQGGPGIPAATGANADSTPVPTMSEWGMILTGLFMLFASFVMIRRKRDN